MGEFERIENRNPPVNAIEITVFTADAVAVISDLRSLQNSYKVNHLTELL